MAHKSLDEQRADWRRQVWAGYKFHRWAMLLFVLAGAWLIPQLFGDLLGLVAQALPSMGWLSTLSYLGYALLLVPYVALMTLPLALAGAGPYPTRARAELNEQLRAAWLKSQTAGEAPASETRS